MIIEILLLIICIVGAIVSLYILLRWDKIISLAESLRRKKCQR